jgi:hypothetical protein
MPEGVLSCPKIKLCVVFAALTGRSPVGNSYLANIDAQTATFLQNVAWDTVQEYYGK